MDAAGIVVRWNAQAERILGIPPDRIVGRKWADCVTVVSSDGVAGNQDRNRVIEPGRWHGPTRLRVAAGGEAFKVLNFARNLAEGKGYAELKTDLAEIVVEALGPFQRRMTELGADKSFTLDVLRDGAERAAVIAERTMAKVRDRMGFVPRP